MSRVRRTHTRRASKGYRSIESYLLPSSSSVPIVISDDEKDEKLLLQSSQQATQSESLSQPSSPPPPLQEMTAAIRKERCSPRTSSLRLSFAINVDDDSDSDDDRLPLTALLSGWARQSSLQSSQSQSQPTAAVPSARSSSSSAQSMAVVRGAIMSDITNIVNAGPVEMSRKRAKSARDYEQKKSYYQLIRAQLSHPDDNTMCARCGIREHSQLHHEDDFKRAGTVSTRRTHLIHPPVLLLRLLYPHQSSHMLVDNAQIRTPSLMTPAQLQAEVKRCTRKDGTIGLVALCSVCHRKAERPVRYACHKHVLRAIARNRRLDSAAKIARGACECGNETCHRRVTAEDVAQFEWDHLVQSFDDPGYHKVGYLVSRGAPTAVCDRERAKCRLLYFKCHRRHTAEQNCQAARRRAEQA